MSDIMKKLNAPFKPDDIEWRVQRAMSTQRGNKAVVLAYVTNRAIMNRLDEVFGPGGWRNEYQEWRDKGVLCGISAKIDDEWVTKFDGAEETNIEAVKGGFSGSMKRAAVQWGIGRYLYNLDEVWVDVKEKGNNYINDKKANVKGYWNDPLLPSWALPQLSLEEVKEEWMKKGGTQPQFMDYIKTHFSVEDEAKLTQQNLAGLKSLLEKRTAS